MKQKKIYSTPQLHCSPSVLCQKFMEDFIQSLTKETPEVSDGEVGSKERVTSPEANAEWGDIW